MEDMLPDLGGLGQELRQLRKSRGLRIADLAARMQRSTGWINLFVYGAPEKSPRRRLNERGAGAQN